MELSREISPNGMCRPSAEEVSQILNNYFPKVSFFKQPDFMTRNTPKVLVPEEDINKYFVLNQNAEWILDIRGMSQNEYFKHLFPRDMSHWNNDNIYHVDVIKFFLDKSDESFLREFRKSKKDMQIKLEPSISDCFLDEIDSIHISQRWDFSQVVRHKLKNKIHQIYEAFTRYAHRQYTLLGFVFFDKNLPTSDLLESGEKIALGIVNDLFRLKPLSSKSRFMYGDLIGLMNETLETFPTRSSDYPLSSEERKGPAKGISYYIPTDLNTFKNQFTGNYFKKIRHIKANYDNTDEGYTSIFNQQPFSSEDKDKIGEYFSKIEIYLDAAELERIKKSSRYDIPDEKLNIINQFTTKSTNIDKQSDKKIYDDKELENISRLNMLRNPIKEIDKPIIYSDGDTSLIDTIKDNNLLSPEDKLIKNEQEQLRKLAGNNWLLYFKNELKKVFIDKAICDDESLNLFFDHLPDHFDKYPLNENNGIVENMKRYDKEILFKTFCICNGIEEDKVLLRRFKGLMDIVINRANMLREQLRSGL